MAAKKSKDEKKKRVIPLRAPGKSVEPNDARPSKMLFDEVLRQSQNEETFNPTQTRTEPRPEADQRQTKTSNKPTNKPNLPVAPMSDFNKRANSLDRDALPLGFFPGASKKIYDAVYLRTRGAIVPTRSIQATRKELMSWSGIQNIKTINAHLKRLKDSGLFKIINLVGEQSGSIYEIFLPEEIGLDLDQTQTTQTRAEPAPVPVPNQKTDSDQNQKTVRDRLGKTVENKPASADSKTFFKTLKLIDDDAPVVSALESLNAAARAATGKELTQKDMDAFGEIIELIIAETTVAATRTKSISIYLKFAAENLRRRLYQKQQLRPEKLKAFEPGAPPAETNFEVEEFVVEPLGERKEEILENLRRVAEVNGREAIEVYRENYTPEDWRWMMENFEKGNG